MGKKELGTKREYTQEFKMETVRLAESIGGNAAASRLGVAQSTVTNWVRRRKGLVPAMPASGVAARRPVSELEAENMRLRRELANAKPDLDSVKKSGGVFREGVAMKYAWIEPHRDAFSVTRMCARLEVSRSRYNPRRGRKPSDRARSNEQLDAAVVKLHAASKSSYGRPRILQSLRKQGHRG